ncbi:uncharacterized protein TRIADDRAFT_61434 [Trichoplax adhaerens]|uniref:EGF-like domain-containing protein n=1 Tax=Trichoplax adhaerens TaxID=10228 RepID=B3SAZ3_TRIAD|nr:hypothetical protein TRIADDRAFT_61434 [Trichoplax adhaerens]EDV20018.1 hypothetical protein TRIADDRAFT_61434 [Trichoplax adhaerens]|eukprot:XP_002117402.1 hypothetical protein TRIADDRAFT_61434 [Trichoplax adhaerens]
MYDFDFLDNVRTRSPCGMPENATGTGIFKTKLITGSKISITWHMAFPHGGGFRIQILHGNGTILHELTPTNNTNPWYSISNSTIQSYLATLPSGFTCDHCIIRLTRNAKEWSTPSGPYIFWSCADVEVNNFQCNQLNCYHGGSIASNCNSASAVCSCPNNQFSGDRCQYMNECETYADCNNNGLCVTINQDYYYPLKQCFCSAGFYGYKCSKTSNLTVVMPNDVSSYSYTKLDNSSEIWYKILSATNEVEVIHKTLSTSWVGLGWRPQGLKASCQFFPPGAAPCLISGPESAVGEGGNQPEGNSESTSKPEGGAESTAQPEGNAGSTAQPEGNAESTAKPEGEGGSSESGGAAGNLVTHAMDCTDMVIGSARGNMFRLFDYYSRDRSTPRMDSYFGGEDSITAAVGSESNGYTTLRWRKQLTAEGTTDHTIQDEVLDVIYAYGQKYPYSHQFPSGLHNSHRLTNYYNDDELKYHGYQNRGRKSLNFFGDSKLVTNTCSGSWKTGCTGNSCSNNLQWNIYNDGTVHFTMSAVTDKWIGLGISNDHKMAKTDAIVGWVGKVAPVITDRYISSYAPPPVDAVSNVNLLEGSKLNGTTTLKFYRPINTSDSQDISLHGCHYFIFAIGGQYTDSNFAISKHASTPFITSRKICIDVNQCSKSYSPLGIDIMTSTPCSGSWGTRCLNGQCASNLRWNVYNDGTVHFQMSADTDKWLAMGISVDKKMPSSDAIVGWISQGTAKLRDRFLKGYFIPAVDAITNVDLINGSLINGITTLNFKRAMNTSDSQNDVSLHGCHYFFLGTGGSYDDNNLDIGVHPQTPAVAKIPMCLYASRCTQFSPPGTGAAGTIFTLIHLVIAVLSVLISSIF